jgi:pyridoxal 5'-phosphate synthase pdxS subunit
LFYKDAKRLGEISKNLGEPMVGINISSLPQNELMAGRGW